MGRSIKGNWEYKGDREVYTNRVLHYILTNGLQLSDFLRDIKYKGVILPDKLVTGLYERLTANPLNE